MLAKLLKNWKISFFTLLHQKDVFKISPKNVNYLSKTVNKFAIKNLEQLRRISSRKDIDSRHFLTSNDVIEKIKFSLQSLTNFSKNMLVFLILVSARHPKGFLNIFNTFFRVENNDSYLKFQYNKSLFTKCSKTFYTIVYQRFSFV